ncbi:MAG: O-antigen ligase family protein [Elusimicrobiota bacterium]|jgi:O-antigen ligase
MINASKLTERYGLSFLLVLGFCLQGAKTPLSFCVWATPLLLLIVPLMTTNNVVNKSSPADLRIEFLLLFLILLSFFGSRDISASLFWTTQALVYWVLWITLKMHPKLLKQDDLFWHVCSLLVALSALKTLWEWHQGLWSFSSGFLPINRIFNALWMTALSFGLLARWQRPGTDKKRWSNRLELLLAIGLLFIVVQGPSRSAFLASIAGVMYLGRPWLTARRVLIGCVAGVVIALGIPPIQTVIARHLRTNEVQGRIPIWGIAIKAIADNPLMGYGAGNFEMAYQRYAFPIETDPIRFGRTTQFAHNEYLQLASEYGLGTAVLFLTALAGLFWKYGGKRGTHHPEAYVALLVMAMGSLTNIVWHMPFLVFLSLVWAATLYHDSQKRISTTPTPVAGLCLVSVCLWGLLGSLALRDHWAQNQRWDRLARWEPWDAEAWHQLSLQQQDAGSAVAFHKKSVRLSPWQLYYRESFGRALEATQRLDDLPQALSQYHTALQLAPGRATNALALGRIHFRMGDPSAALSWFERARQFEPRYWETDLWMARCYRALGQKRHAIKLLENLQARYNREGFSPSADFSDYDRAILSYDPSVVAKQLAQWRF